MVAVEHPFDIGKVEHFVVAVIPRQIEECIQIGILQCVFRRVHAVAHQTPHFLLSNALPVSSDHSFLEALAGSSANSSSS